MKIWTVVYNDDAGVRTDVFNNPGSVNAAILTWLETYWEGYVRYMDEPFKMPSEWREAYGTLEDNYSGFMDSVHVDVHHVHPPVTTGLDAIIAEHVSDIREGDLELDQNAVVSMGDDPGAYVSVWKWVQFADVYQHMVITEVVGGHVIVWYFECFEQFMEAWKGAPEGTRFERGTPELLEKSTGVNDAWEFLTAADDSLKLEEIPVEKLQELRRKGRTIGDV